MKFFYSLLCSTALAFSIGISTNVDNSFGAAPVDADGDGFKSNKECDDTNALIYPGAPEIACDGVDQDCTGDDLIDCGDANCSADPSCQTCVPETEIACDGVDQDCDGDDLIDCGDANCSADPSCQTCVPETEIVCDGIDQDCDGDDLIDCGDANCSADPSCSSSAEDCKDGIDNNGDGKTDCADSDCSADSSCVNAKNSSHMGINEYLGPQTCIACHADAGNHVLNSVHGAWDGLTPEVTDTINGLPTNTYGKWGQSNNYCTDPEMADFACLKCHVTFRAPVDGQGKVDLSASSNLNANDMDCMQCHQENYAATFMPDGSYQPEFTPCTTDGETQDGTPRAYNFPVPGVDGYKKVIRLDLLPGETEISLARTVHMPNNATCLMPCHAAAGGGDGTKRGDLGSGMVNPPVTQDVHLSSAGNAGYTCTACHVATNHQIPGRGNDLRPSDIGATMKQCVDCHIGMDSGTGHQDVGVRGEPDRHVARVSCQACHIDVYAKGVGTETSRDWTVPHWSADGCEGQGAYVGEELRGTDLIPEYRFWNGTSYVYDRNGSGLQTDPVDGGLAMSYPNGGINDGKLFPFKIHTSKNPVNTVSKKTNFDVMQMFTTGCYDNAAVEGLAFIGETGPYTWEDTKAYQLITHGIAPAVEANDCTKCHGNTKDYLDPTSESKLDKLGYALKDTEALICTQCHRAKSPRGNVSMHGHLAKGSGIGCYFCHDFRRPERGLCDPCDETCVTEYVDNVAYPHTCP